MTRADRSSTTNSAVGRATGAILVISAATGPRARAAAQVAASILRDRVDDPSVTLAATTSDDDDLLSHLISATHVVVLDPGPLRARCARLLGAVTATPRCTAVNSTAGERIALVAVLNRFRARVSWVSGPGQLRPGKLLV